jgi:hypothetical protein
MLTFDHEEMNQVKARRYGSRTGAVALAAAVVVAGGLFASSAPADAVQSGIAADELPSHAVEDFNYPGADRILAERGIELKRGDGHIVLVDCSGENLLRVSARGQDNQAVCFRVTGNSGWLTLELPAAFLVWTNSYGNTHLKLEADSGDTQSYDVGPNDLQSIGESDPDSGGQEFALLEIRVTR